MWVLRREEVGTSLTDVCSGTGSREVLRLRRWNTMVESAIGHWRRGRWRAHVLESRLILQMMRHHGMRWRRVGFGSIIASLIIIIVIIYVFLPHEVLGAFVFVWTAILDRVSRCRRKSHV